jgi:prepilin-type N-terminal cleavage/methylation domain-containing protein
MPSSDRLRYSRSSRGAFTLIELLVVIAIIAILAVVVVLTLNPAQLLAQSRDATRVSDMATLNTAIGLYQTDSGGTGFMGTSTIVYTSLADTSSTCGSWGLVVPPSSTYNCTVSTSLRSTNSNGWIPINFASISAGTPLGSLPIDPINTSSSGLFYTYYASGSQFVVTAVPESIKQKTALVQNPVIPNYSYVFANGSNVTINPLFNPSGLVGWWPMDEGAGSSTLDLSANGNIGTWVGTPAGTNGTYYTAGRVGSWGGYFNGTNNYVNLPTSSLPVGDNPMSMTAWIYFTGTTSTLYNPIFDMGNWSSCQTFGLSIGTGLLNVPYCMASAFTITPNTWSFVAATHIPGSTTIYFNGQSFTHASTENVTYTATSPAEIGQFAGGGGNRFPGVIDDVRVYNRALSAAELQVLYVIGR